jgi:hypothetical protein
MPNTPAKKTAAETAADKAKQDAQDKAAKATGANPAAPDAAAKPSAKLSILEKRGSFQVQQLPDGKYEIIKMPEGNLIFGSHELSEVMHKFEGLFRN